MPEGPLVARRFPTGVVVIVVVILLLGLVGFAGFNAGWFSGETWQKPISAVQDFFSGVKLPSWFPFVSKDTTPPVISEVVLSDITETGATVRWLTNEPATSQVMICDPSGRCTWTDLDETLVTEHTVVLSGLEPGLTYHLTITSTDARGNQSLHETDFTTKGKETAVTLAISGISVTNVTETAATITWSTNQPARGQLEYGTTTSYGNSTPLSGELTSHKAVLSGLSPNTTYHYRIKVQDAAGREVVSEDRTFKTRSAVTGVEKGTTVGKLAEDFTLPDLEGKKVSLSQFRGKVVMVKFWVDSQSCRTELPIIQSFYQKWQDKGFVVLAVNWMQTPEQVKAFVKDKGLTFTVLLDENGEVNAKYGVKPSIYAVTIVVDKNGVIRERRDPAFKSELQIEAVVKPLLEGE
jgi:peroxiredoxin